jgi:hypothetical protein
MTFAKKIATSCFGVLSAFALVSPAFAQVNGGSIVQTSDQTAIQSGVGNVSLQNNAQNAHLHQMGSGANGTAIMQGNSQFAGQDGFFNTSIQDNQQDATVHQGPGFPYYPGVNGTEVIQGATQGTAQYGWGNESYQMNDSSAHVDQSGYPTFLPY